MDVTPSTRAYRIGLDESYRPLPSLYLAFLLIWFVSACSWTMNTYKNRHFQTNNLQWLLASVPLIKALQLTLSFLFWYSCFNFEVCSLWISFGVYVTGVLFQTACFVSFLLISHGYCIMCERLSVTERRTTAALGCVFYLTLVGYRASVPYFTVLLLLNYFVSFSLIFHHISQNLAVLRGQLSFIEDEDVHTMRDAVYTKYMMFKKFQVAMQIVAMTETVIYINMDDSSETYWLRLLVREWAQFCIFMYIGWTFRSQDLTPGFSVMPTLKSKGETMVPPIYTIEMDAATFKDFSRRPWHIGVNLLFHPGYPDFFYNGKLIAQKGIIFHILTLLLKPTSPTGDSSKDALLVIIQHPHAYRLTTPAVSSPSPASVSTSSTGVPIEISSHARYEK